MTDEITLDRTGLPPVAFTGTLLAEVADDPPPYKGNEENDRRRWHVLRLFRHEDGRFIVAIGFRTRHDKETPNDEVIVCRDQAELFRVLSLDDNQYDPCEYLQGYPESWPGDEKKEHSFRQKQARLEMRVNDDFAARVSQLLRLADLKETI